MARLAKVTATIHHRAMRFALLCALAAGTLAGLACSSNGSASNDDAGMDCPPDSADGDECPNAEPTDHWNCFKTGLVCSYGNDPRVACRMTATCKSAGGTWTIDQPTCPPLSTACPAKRESAAGQPCATQDAICNYDGLGCTCTNCSSGGGASICSGPTTWHCATPNADPQCPAAPPNVGAKCTTEGKKCNYGCGARAIMTCTGGAWSPQASPCPV